LEKERLLGKFTAEPNPPSTAVADASPNAAVPKVAVRWSGTPIHERRLLGGAR
jgi:hypothetical protein